jgi:hypothetical protein
LLLKRSAIQDVDGDSNNNHRHDCHDENQQEHSLALTHSWPPGLYSTSKDCELFWSTEVTKNSKSQISNIKQITMTKIQNLFWSFSIGI